MSERNSNPEKSRGSKYQDATTGVESDLDILKIYLDQVGRYPLLSDNDAATLARLAQIGDIKARERLVVSNLRLVVGLASNQRERGLSLLDLIQEGTLGLLDAVAKFDPGKGFKFSTYATDRIEGDILRAIDNQGKTIRLPVHIHEYRNKVKKAKRKLIEDGVLPTSENIAAEAKLKLKHVLALHYLPKVILSLDGPATSESDSASHEELIGASGVNVEEEVISSLREQALEEFIDALPQPQRDVCKLAFGFGEGPALKPGEIGRALNIHPNRVRAIEKAAVAALATSGVVEVLLT